MSYKFSSLNYKLDYLTGELIPWKSYTPKINKKIKKFRTEEELKTKEYIWWLFSMRNKRRFCQICGSKEKLECDHIIPITRGGQNIVKNLQLLCRSCNAKKGTKIYSLDDYWELMFNGDNN